MKTPKTASKTQLLKAINAAFVQLEVLDEVSNTHYLRELYAMCEAEEKGHRRFCGGQYGISVAQAARLFAVVRIAEFMAGTKLPEVKDYLHFQKSAFYAAALVCNYRDEITTAWKDVDAAQLATIRYDELV